MKVLKSILSGFVDLLMLVVIVFAIGVTLLSLTSDRNDVSKIGKYMPLNVKTNSMEPTIMKGDFIVVEDCDPETLEVGDVISFLATEQDKTLVKTHRIVSVDSSSGFKTFVTRGDNNAVDDDVPVFAGDIIGLWKEVRLPKVGTIIDFVSSKTGFLICIVFPLLVLFVYQIYKFVVVVIEERNSSKEKNEAAILEAAAKIQAKREKEKDKEK